MKGQWRRHAGTTGHQQRKQDEVSERHKDIIQAILSGKSIADAAIEFDRPPSRIYAILRNAGYRKIKLQDRDKIPYHAYRKFLRQVDSAKQRGIEWRLTLDEWWTIWHDSKRWPQRGPRRGQYVMSRPGDRGPYALGNVFIQLASDNIKEGHRIKKS